MFKYKTESQWSALWGWKTTQQGGHDPDLIPSKTSINVVTKQGSNQNEFLISLEKKNKLSKSQETQGVHSLLRI